MCIAIPGRITDIEDSTAKVDFNGNVLDVNIGLIDAEVGQYVLVHAGCAIEVMNEDKAKDIIDLFSQMEI